MSIGKLNIESLQEVYCSLYYQVELQLPSKNETLKSKHELTKAIHILKRKLINLRSNKDVSYIISNQN